MIPDFIAQQHAMLSATAGPVLPISLHIGQMDSARLKELLNSIYNAVDELEAMFPGRHFTPDGHMIGSLGEALAAYNYGVKLSAASSECHDGSCNGMMVQVKATQGNRVSISSEPEHLLVLKLERNGEFIECYNGPGALVWQSVSHKIRPKNGQYQVSLYKLEQLMLDVSETSRLKRVPSEPLPN